MESSFDSFSPEPTVSGFKSKFKKPATFSAPFEVSINESKTVAQIHRSDLDLDRTSKPNTLRPFKSQRKSNQGFNTSAHKITLNSESEQSVVFIKHKTLFGKQQVADSFDVTYNESNSSPTVEPTCSKEPVLVKNTNPFGQSNKENEITVRVEESKRIDPGDHFSFCDSGADNVCSTTFPTKPNPFRKTTKGISEVSGNDSVRSQRDRSRIDADSTSWMTKDNPFGRQKPTQDTLHLSLMEQRTCESTQRSKSPFTDIEAADLNISLSKAHSETYINESSINDENLNNWMSDQSEDEVPPPTVPSITKNLSITKEKQNTSRMEKSPSRTNWEEKVNEIISKAQKKTDTQASTPHKPKKTTATENQEKKYRPKKHIKSAPFATKPVYQFILKKFKSKYGINAVLEAEQMVLIICDTVKKVQRRKSHQKSLIQGLKKKMAKSELIETTVDFYEFVIRYLPYDFRVKVVPCLQPVTNTVYPQKDVINPFDKIL